MTERLFHGYVEIEADLKRGIIWVNDGDGICRLRICRIPRLAERITYASRADEWMLNITCGGGEDIGEEK